MHERLLSPCPEHQDQGKGGGGSCSWDRALLISQQSSSVPWALLLPPVSSLWPPEAGKWHLLWFPGSSGCPEELGVPSSHAEMM